MNFNNLENRKIENIEKPDILKGEHLNKGIKPITGAIYERENLDSDSISFFNEFEKNADYVNFSYSKQNIKENNMYNSGEKTYVISLCNNKNKYSDKYLNCTGLILVGEDKETGENISFLSHQNPEFFLKNETIKINFNKDLNENLDNIINRCTPGTIDAVILGGNEEEVSDFVFSENFRRGVDDDEIFMREKLDTYQDSVKRISFIVSKKLYFKPVVITGPNDNFKTKDHSLSIYFDTKNRRLYQIRPKQDSVNNESFNASDIESQILKIKNK